MSSYLTRLMHCIVIILIVIVAMIFYAMPDQEVRTELNETCVPTSTPACTYTPTPVHTQTPVPAPTMAQPTVSPTIDISALSMYDRDNDGNLSKHERGVVEYDYLHKLLTAAQIKCAAEILGYVPSLSPTPTATAKITPTPSANESDVPANTTQNKFEAIEQWRADVETGIKDNMIGDKVQEFVQWCIKTVSGIRVW